MNHNLKVHEQDMDRLRAQNEKLRHSARVALGWLTGGMDGDWRNDDVIELLRDALAPDYSPDYKPGEKQHHQTKTD